MTSASYEELMEDSIYDMLSSREDQPPPQRDTLLLLSWTKLGSSHFECTVSQEICDCIKKVLPVNFPEVPLNFRHWVMVWYNAEESKLVDDSRAKEIVSCIIRV